MDWTGGQIRNDDSANDVRDCDLSRCHHLFGPIEVEGAEPGDLLMVDNLDIGAHRGNEWGLHGDFLGQQRRRLSDRHFPRRAQGDLGLPGIYATSRHIPGVRFAGITHPDLIGCAPSHELLAKWNKREAELIATDPDRVPPRALPPLETGILLGSMKGDELNRAAKEAARTIPPREHGGNCDIKNISRGSRIYFPGLRQCRKLSGGVHKYRLEQAMFKVSPVDQHYSHHLVFEGIGVGDDGKQYYNDATIAYRRACLKAINYLKNFGYSGEQAYTILSCAPVEGRVGGSSTSPTPGSRSRSRARCSSSTSSRTRAGRKKHVDSSRPTWRAPAESSRADGAPSGRPVPRGAATVSSRELVPMPLYDYVCDGCGPFRAWQPMAQAMRPTPCPACGESGERALSAPHLRRAAAVIRYRAEAHNEKSAHEPMVVRHLKGGQGHAGHAHHHHRPPKRRKRPWMIGHS